MVPIPDATREDVLAAMAKFDAELRDTDEWREWESRRNHRFAIQHEGRQYPVKHIVADAARVGSHEFSGGYEANRWLRNLRLAVVALRHDIPTVSNWWWVNQNATFELAAKGGYLWAPKRDRRCASLGHRTNLSRMAVGDGVMHYADGAVRAVGAVLVEAIDYAGPPGRLPDFADEEGYLVRVAYHPLSSPISMSEIPSGWRTGQDGPFDSSGGIKQGYVFPLDAGFIGNLATSYASRLPVGVFDWEALTLLANQEAIARIRRAVERMYPDEQVRLTCLDQLAESILRAHGISPNSWSTRLSDANSLRLNVSWAQACVLGRDNIYLVLDEEVLEKHIRERIIEAEIDGTWRGQEFTSMPFARGVHLPVGRLDDLLPLVQAAHASLIDRSARQVRTRSNYHLKHQPEIIAYLREALGRNVPQPAYLASTEAQRAKGGGYGGPPFPAIHAAVAAQGMRLDERTLRRYHLALKTRGFVVLSGLSGVGKTWLAEAYANAVGARHAVVAVAPNWTTNEDLLGYHNPLTGVYHHTTFSRFVREAGDAYLAAVEDEVEPQPFHLVLDEMNLARVEYYFALFLSDMEVRARHGSATMALGGGEELLLPPNLFVIGTVNVDETTHGFADKVYDRAQLIELEVRKEVLAAHLAGKNYAADILEVWDAVQHVGPFAFRILDEIHAYVSAAEAMNGHWSHALDEQILQKILPKLKGADPRVGAALADVARVCADQFPLSYAKANRMLADFNRHGFASYFG